MTLKMIQSSRKMYRSKNGSIILNTMCMNKAEAKSWFLSQYRHVAFGKLHNTCYKWMLYEAIRAFFCFAFCWKNCWKGIGGFFKDLRNRYQNIHKQDDLCKRVTLVLKKEYKSTMLNAFKLSFDYMLLH